jgi:tetratricopeptide (TPR) repeat protein
MPDNRRLITQSVAHWSYSYITQLIFLAAYLCLVFYLFGQGLSGTFLFDDYANLSEISNVTDINSFIAYSLSGISGPTGRPISLASFALFSEDWENQAKFFIAFNIVIHLINCVLVFIFIKHVVTISNNKSISTYVPIVATLIWAVLPNHVSSVNYIVQRMTLLSATFSLISLISMLNYIKEHNLLKPPKIAWLILSGASLIAAILSKENGIMTVLILYLLFELTDKTKPLPITARLFKFTALLSSVIVMLIIISYGFNSLKYAARDFTVTERIFTQFIVLRDYISHFIFPRPITNGIFNDSYNIVNTQSEYALAAIFGLIILITTSFSAWRYFKAQHLAAFFLLFFFINHFLESTFIPLEIYFEHRNYLPYIGLSYLFAYYTTKNIERNLLSIFSRSILVLFLLTNIYFTYQRANLWGNPLKAATTWAVLNKNSARAQEHAAVTFSKAKNMEGAIAFLVKAYEIDPDPFIPLNALNLSCKAGFELDNLKVPVEDFKSAKYSNRSFNVLVETVFLSQKKNCYYLTQSSLLNIIQNVIDNPNYIKRKRQHPFLYLKGLVKLHTENNSEAVELFNQAIIQNPEPDALLLKARNLINYQLCEEAVMFLDKHENSVYKNSVKFKILNTISPLEEKFDQLRDRASNRCSQTIMDEK